MHYDYYARVETPFTLFDQLYDKPWLRFGSYAVGIAVGYLLSTIKTLKINYIFVIVGWTFSVVCAFALVYGLGKEGLKIPYSALYVSIYFYKYIFLKVLIAVITSKGCLSNALHDCKNLFDFEEAYMSIHIFVILTTKISFFFAVAITEL